MCVLKEEEKMWKQPHFDSARARAWRKRRFYVLAVFPEECFMILFFSEYHRRKYKKINILRCYSGGGGGDGYKMCVFKKKNNIQHKP